MAEEPKSGVQRVCVPEDARRWDVRPELKGRFGGTLDLGLVVDSGDKISTFIFIASR